MRLNEIVSGSLTIGSRACLQRDFQISLASGAYIHPGHDEPYICILQVGARVCRIKGYENAYSAGDAL